jgi:hypothetical protein
MSRAISYILEKVSNEIKNERLFFRRDINSNILNSYDKIKHFIPVKYTFNINTTFTIIDSIRNKCYYYPLASPDEIYKLNSSNNICLTLKNILNSLSPPVGRPITGPPPSTEIHQ